MFFTNSNLQFSLSFFIFRVNIAYIKHKDSCLSKDNLEIHITSKTCVEVNAPKCVENNLFFVFNSRRAIPWLVHPFAPLNIFSRISSSKTWARFIVSSESHWLLDNSLSMKLLYTWFKWIFTLFFCCTVSVVLRSVCGLISENMEFRNSRVTK